MAPSLAISLPRIKPWRPWASKAKLQYALDETKAIAGELLDGASDTVEAECPHCKAGTFKVIANSGVVERAVD